MLRLATTALFLMASTSLYALTYTEYTNRTDWTNAVGSPVTEDFNAEAVGSFTDNRVFTDFTAINTNNVDLVTGVRAGTDGTNVNGTNFLFFEAVCASTDGIELVFNTPVTSVGFDWRNTDGSGDIAQLVVKVDGEIFLFGPPGAGFFGIQATDGAFQTVEIQNTPNQGGCALYSFGMDDISSSASDSDTTYFNVSNTYTDSSTDAVDVTLSCNGGLPLEQNYSLAGDADVTFTLKEFQAGVTDCTITATGAPDGYTTTLNGGDQCTFENIYGGIFNCNIVNSAGAVDYVVDLNWVVGEAGFEEQTYDVDVTVNCQSNILMVNGSVVSPSTQYTGSLGDGDSVTLTVDISAGASSCTATQSLSQSGVEPEASEGCTDAVLSTAGGASCTFTNTVFFEGIPTLSQYGLMILALMMLGVGMVGFRRFV